MLKIVSLCLFVFMMAAPQAIAGSKPARIQQVDEVDLRAMQYKQARKECILGLYGRYLKPKEISWGMFSTVDGCATKKVYGK